jgi:transcription elongation GreA/GreB family factor
MSRPDKARLLACLQERIAAELQTLRESQRAAQDGATHEETRQEDPKDTRAIEAQYIARGLADRVEGLRGTIAALGRVRLDAFGPDDPIALSAVVCLRDEADDSETLYFVVPIAGGEALEDGDSTVTTITPESPLGQALMGKQTEDDIDLQLPRRRLRAVIDWVA